MVKTTAVEQMVELEDMVEKVLLWTAGELAELLRGVDMDTEVKVLTHISGKPRKIPVVSVFYDDSDGEEALYLRADYDVPVTLA